MQINKLENGKYQVKVEKDGNTYYLTRDSKEEAIKEIKKWIIIRRKK